MSPKQKPITIGEFMHAQGRTGVLLKTPPPAPTNQMQPYTYIRQNTRSKVSSLIGEQAAQPSYTLEILEDNIHDPIIAVLASEKQLEDYLKSEKRTRSDADSLRKVHSRISSIWNTLMGDKTLKGNYTLTEEEENIIRCFSLGKAIEKILILTLAETLHKAKNHRFRLIPVDHSIDLRDKIDVFVITKNRKKGRNTQYIFGLDLTTNPKKNSVYKRDSKHWREISLKKHYVEDLLGTSYLQQYQSFARTGRTQVWRDVFFNPLSHSFRENLLISVFRKIQYLEDTTTLPNDFFLRIYEEVHNQEYTQNNPAIRENELYGKIREKDRQAYAAYQKRRFISE